MPIRAQSRPFDQVIVVDNRSTDGSIEMVRKEFGFVDLVVMPNSDYGACETFNIGFACARGEYIGILDDDVVLPSDWVARMMQKFGEEEETTAVLSSKVVEPGMPEEYRNHPEVNRERYMSTFRGCASMAKADILERAGYYDQRLFIYGNERDLAARIMNLGYRDQASAERRGGAQDAVRNEDGKAFPLLSRAQSVVVSVQALLGGFHLPILLPTSDRFLPPWLGQVPG